jgi:hypothetical protein
MKLRVLFLRKSYIYFFIFFIAVSMIILTTSSLLPGIFPGTVHSILTISGQSKPIKGDFTGDGSEDILYINTEGNNYHIQIFNGNTSFHLKPNKKINTVGRFYTHWPMRITTLDINRDKTPEIFVQASSNGSPVLHVFSWNGEKFQDIFCSSNNVIGFLDYSNNKTPKFAAGNISAKNSNFLYYMYINNKMEYFKYEEDNVPGIDSVKGFIQYIHSLPEGEGDVPKDIFYPGLSGQDLAAIGRLSSENNIYLFQDAVFNDTKWDKEGNITEIKWVLNFKGSSRTTVGQTKNYSVTIKLKPHKQCGDLKCFKIFSITYN